MAKTVPAAPRRSPNGRRYIQPYLLFAMGERQVSFPLVHIRLHGRKGSLRTVALADSGATTTFIPIELVEELGVRVTPGPSAGGGGGDFTTYDAQVSFEILHRGNVIASFPHHPVSVPQEPGRIPYIVLGRDSLFRAFAVTFDEAAGRLTLLPR